MTSTTEQIIVAIENGLHDEHINQIWNALSRRHNELLAREQAERAAKIVFGQEAALARIKPRVLVGVRGIVERKSGAGRSKVVFRPFNVTRELARFVKADGTMRVHASCIEMVPAKLRRGPAIPQDAALDKLSREIEGILGADMAAINELADAVEGK